MRSAGPGVACLLLLTTGLAGCASEPTFRSPFASAETSLAVPEVGDGEYARWRVHASGYRNGGSLSRPTLQVIEEAAVMERWVRSDVAAHDAFLQPHAGVEFRTRMTEIGPSREAATVQEGSAVYSLSDRSLLYFNSSRTHSATFGDCWLVFDCRRDEQSWTVDQQVFPREGPAADWGTLAGRLVRAGEVLTFRRDVDPAKPSESYWLRELAAVGIEFLDGERTMHIRESERLIDGSRRPPNVVEGEPRTEHHLWFAARASVPVREVYAAPMEFDGKRYWLNTTLRLQRYDAGDPLRWGVARAEAGAAWGEISLVAKSTTLFEASTKLRYPLSRAWQKIRDDVSLVEFQMFRASNPGAQPYEAIYHPDSERGFYYWTLRVGDSKGPSKVIVESKLHEPASDLGPAGVVSNRVVRENSFGRVPVFDEVGRFARFDEMLSRYARLAGSDEDPGVAISLADARVSFFRPQAASRDGPFGALGETYVARESVTFDLRDGGLAGRNLPASGGRYHWLAPLPWT